MGLVGVSDYTQMKKNILLIFCALAFINVQAQFIFNKVYDRNLNYDGASAVIQTLDGNYLIGGTTANFSLGYDAELFIKINSIGDTIWSKEYDLGPGGGDDVYSIEQLNDSSFIIAGTTYNTSQMNKDAYLLKLNSSGDSIWFRRYGTANDVGYSSKQTPDGGFILAGWTHQGANYEDAFLIKTDSLGNTQWQNTYGGIGGELIYSVELTNDNGFILGGYTTSYGATLGDLYLLKVDSGGNEQWHKKFGGTGSDNGGPAISTLDGGYLIVGSIETPVGSGYQNGYVVKTDNQGILQWNKSIGSNNSYESFANVRQNLDSSYWICGTITDLNTEGWFVELNSNGDSIINKSYRYYSPSPSYIDHYLLNLDLTSDGGAIMCGYTINNLIAEKNNAWILKVDSTGCADTSCLTTEIFALEQKDKLEVFPNPVTDRRLSITYTLPPNKNGKLELIDINGRVVFNYDLPQRSTLQNFILPELSNGIYNCIITSGNEIMRKKIAVINLPKP